jgi:hypothetical protein
MKISSANAILAGLLMSPLSSLGLGPSSCKEQTDALEVCAESAIESSSSTSGILGSCTDERSELSECLGAATPDEPLTGNLTLPPAGGLLACYVYLAFYDACVAVTNTTGSSCPLSCIIDGPDQNCDDYNIFYCERQECCTDCLTYMTEYDTCVANAGSCSVSNPTCSSGKARFSVSLLGVIAASLAGLSISTTF